MNKASQKVKYVEPNIGTILKRMEQTGIKGPALMFAKLKFNDRKIPKEVIPAALNDLRGSKWLEAPHKKGLSKKMLKTLVDKIQEERLKMNKKAQNMQKVPSTTGQLHARAKQIAATNSYNSSPLLGFFERKEKGLGVPNNLVEAAKKDAVDNYSEENAALGFNQRQLKQVLSLLNSYKAANAIRGLNKVASKVQKNLSDRFLKS